MARSARRSTSCAHSSGSPNIRAFVQRVGARRAALDEVAGDGERGPGEADQGRVAQLGGEVAHRLEHVGRVDLGLEGSQAVEVGGRAEGLRHHRTGARGHVDAEADGRDGHHDVGVEDRRVDAVSPDRLEGDLGGHVGLADRVEDAALAADGAVLGQGASGLTHEPHRDVGRGLPSAGAEEWGVGMGRHGVTVATAWPALAVAVAIPPRATRHGRDFAACPCPRSSPSSWPWPRWSWGW